MNRLRTVVMGAFLALPSVAFAGTWVTLGASVTEIVFALGKGGDVIGVDGTSAYPAEASVLPKVGSHHHVNVESVLALEPDAVIASSRVGPPQALEQLEAAGVKVVRVDDPLDLPGARARIAAVAGVLGVDAEAKALLARFDAMPTWPSNEGPRVAFVYARGAGTLLLGGKGSGVDALVHASGAVLVGGHEGFRPITAEGLVAAEPDVILFTDGGLASLGGVDGVLKVPGVALTPAGAAGRVVSIDDLLLLGFGPRTPDAVAALHDLWATTP